MPKLEKTHIGHKLVEAMELKSVTQADVAREFRVKPPSVNEWVKYGRIHKDHIRHLVEYFRLPYDWWFGETSVKSKPATTGGDNIVYLKWYHETRLAAGSGITIEADGEVKDLAFRADWLRQKGLSLETTVAVHADGPSMRPRIEDRDLLLVNTRAKEIVNGKVYAFTQGRKGRVKRLYRTASKSLRIVSDNPDFEPETLEPEKQSNITIIGRVVWIAGSI
jgi:phage repressor protein C with HTH and peptisase S24 domain